MISFIMFILVAIIMFALVNNKTVETKEEELERKEEELRTIYMKYLTNEDVLNEMIKTLREKYK